MKKLVWVLVFALVGFVFFGTTTQASSGRIAIVFATGGLGDQSFNDSAYRGMQMAKEQLGISFDFVEPTSVADYEALLTQFSAQRVYDLIISIGFDQADALEVVAGRFPNQKFAIVDMVVMKPNVASFVYKEQERGFLVGAAAALMTKRGEDPMIKADHKRIGVIGGMSIPLINANIAGYITGAQYVDKEVQVRYSYVGDWADPGRGLELAVSMIEDGVDVIWGAAGRSGLGVLRAAQEHNIYGIGADSDQGNVAPLHVLTNGMKYVDNTVLLAIGQVVRGEFQPGINFLGVKEDALGYSRSLLPADVIAELEVIREKIASGEIEIPDTIEEALK